MEQIVEQIVGSSKRESKISAVLGRLRGNIEGINVLVSELADAASRVMSPPPPPGEEPVKAAEEDGICEIEGAILGLVAMTHDQIVVLQDIRDRLRT